ncbi:MAG TPA: hypothetical protein VII98_03880, partial [Solirubrobacteraceae bacterium]
DAATSALTAERARVVPRPAPAPPRAQPPAVAPVAVPAPAHAPAHPPAAETDALIAGLARAADRLRAQAPPEGLAVAPPAPVPEAPAPVAAPVQVPAPVSATPGRGGLLGALERALRNVR